MKRSSSNVTRLVVLVSGKPNRTPCSRRGGRSACATKPFGIRTQYLKSQSENLSVQRDSESASLIFPVATQCGGSCWARAGAVKARSVRAYEQNKERLFIWISLLTTFSWQGTSLTSTF